MASQAALQWGTGWRYTGDIRLSGVYVRNPRQQALPRRWQPCHGWRSEAVRVGGFSGAVTEGLAWVGS